MRGLSLEDRQTLQAAQDAAEKRLGIQRNNEAGPIHVGDAIAEVLVKRGIVKQEKEDEQENKRTEA